MSSEPLRGNDTPDAGGSGLDPADEVLLAGARVRLASERGDHPAAHDAMTDMLRAAAKIDPHDPGACGCDVAGPHDDGSTHA